MDDKDANDLKEILDSLRKIKNLADTGVAMGKDVYLFAEIANIARSASHDAKDAK